MRPVLLLFGLAAALALAAPLAQADDARTSFERALAQDAAGAADLAYAFYKRAAEAGLPEAEFNVASMLDTGRGVASDVTQAATWYARSAAHGNNRAAYNLGQLYEAGEGVPRNADLSRAWFSASNLAAARDRLAVPPPRGSASEPLRVPTLVQPMAGSDVNLGPGGIVFVWTSEAQPEPVRFYVEARELNASGSREAFSGFIDTSSLLAALPTASGRYVWRVLAVARKADRYVSSGWLRFNLKADEHGAQAISGR